MKRIILLGFALVAAMSGCARDDPSGQTQSESGAASGPAQERPGPDSRGPEHAPARAKQAEAVVDREALTRLLDPELTKAIELPTAAEPMPADYELHFVATAAPADCESGPDCRQKGLEAWTKGGPGHPDPQHRRAAYMLYRAACARGDGRGCWEQASALDTMFPVPADEADANDTAATALYRRSCDLGYGRGCYTFGLRLGQPAGRQEPDWEAAAPWLELSTALYTRACAAGQHEDCALLAYNYNSGRGVERSAEKAAGLYRFACDAVPDDGYSCDQLAKLLDGTRLGARDTAAAHEAWAKGCARDPHFGCRTLGVAYLEGDGVPKDLSKAIEWFRKGCPPEGPTDAVCCRRLTRLCKGGDAEAC